MVRGWNSVSYSCQAERIWPHDFFPSDTQMLLTRRLDLNRYIDSLKQTIFGADLSGAPAPLGLAFAMGERLCRGNLAKRLFALFRRSKIYSLYFLRVNEQAVRERTVTAAAATLEHPPTHPPPTPPSPRPPEYLT